MPWIETNGLKSYYKVTGNKDGKPLIFVHSALCDGNEFKEQEQYFSKHYKIYALDLREHGQSKSNLSYRINLHRAPHRASISLIVRDLEEFVNKLGLKNFILCSSSFGCHPSLVYTARNQDKVDGLIMLNYRRFIFMEKVARVILRPFKPFTFLFTELILHNYIPGLTRKIISRITDNHKNYTKEELVELLNKIDRRALYFIINAELTYREPWLKKIHMLVFIINGENSRALRSRYEKLGKTIDNLEVIFISNAGHSAHIENPEATNLQIKRCLEKIMVENEK